MSVETAKHHPPGSGLIFMTVRLLMGKLVLSETSQMSAAWWKAKCVRACVVRRERISLCSHPSTSKIGVLVSVANCISWYFLITSVCKPVPHCNNSSFCCLMAIPFSTFSWESLTAYWMPSHWVAPFESLCYYIKLAPVSPWMTVLYRYTITILLCSSLGLRES